MLGRLDKLSLPVSAARMLLREPVELIDRLEARNEKAAQARGRRKVTPNRSDAFAAAHEAVGISSCGECVDHLARVDERIWAPLGGRHRQDGGGTLAHILWIVVRHTRPERVVETGVARGVSSAFILDALDVNDFGHLYSIDLPPLRRDWRGDGGSAVPASLHGRWDYIRGASRRRLPPLLEQLDTVDLFVHDGLHTAETMTFEFHQVWPHIAKDGLLLSDDVDGNLAFVTFAQRCQRDALLIAEEEKEGVVGILRR